MRVCSSNHEGGDKIKKHTLDQIVNRYLSRILFDEAEEMCDIVNAIKELGIQNTLIEVIQPNMKRLLPKFNKIIKEICNDQKQLKGLDSDDEELFDIIDEVELDKQSVNLISRYMQFEREFHESFKKSQKEVFK